MNKHRLRERAERAVRGQSDKVAAQPPHELQRLVHELQVHQIELELQYEELRSARIDAEHARERYLELFQAAPTGYLTLNERGVIVECNGAAESLLGRARHELLSHALQSLASPADRPGLRVHLLEARERPRSSAEIRVMLPNGTQPVMRLDTSPVPSSPGNCLVVLTDMTQRQHQKEQLEALNRELERRVAERTAELESQNRQLQAEIEARTRAESQRAELEAQLRETERLRGLGMLAAGVAHDFNNLLVSVIGNAELLLSSPELPEQAREPLSVIRRTGQDAAELTRQLLVFAGQGRMQPSSVALGEVVTDSVALLRPRLGPELRVITSHQDRERTTIRADRAQMQRVVLNLLTNALEALEGHGTIEVGIRSAQLDAAALATFQHASAAQPGPFVLLHVADTGRGIDAASASRIFEPFFSTKFTGRGLGLATVLGVVQSHGGAIRVHSQPGAGTRFEVALPAAEPLPSAAPAVRAPEPCRASGSVLLIDDDAKVRNVVAQLLRALGLEVIAAEGGEAGLQRLAQTPQAFDFVLLDWLMPGMSGASVLRELREHHPELPVILMSGYSTDQLGDDDAHLTRIQKPMTLQQLQAAVRQVRRGKSTAGR